MLKARWKPACGLDPGQRGPSLWTLAVQSGGCPGSRPHAGFHSRGLVCESSLWIGTCPRSRPHAGFHSRGYPGSRPHAGFHSRGLVCESMIFEDLSLYPHSLFEIPGPRFEGFLKGELTFQWLETGPANPGPGTCRQNPPQLRKQLRFRAHFRIQEKKMVIWINFEPRNVKSQMPFASRIFLGDPPPFSRLVLSNGQLSRIETTCRFPFDGGLVCESSLWIGLVLSIGQLSRIETTCRFPFEGARL